MISSFELDVYLGSGGLLALPPVKPRSALCLNVPGLFLEHPNSARLLWPVRRPNVRPAVPFSPPRGGMVRAAASSEEQLRSSLPPSEVVHLG